MPFFNDLGFYYGSSPSSSYSGIRSTSTLPSFYTPSYMSYASTSRYSPYLPTVSELRSLNRIPSPRAPYLRPININTADIDVSSARRPRAVVAAAKAAVRSSGTPSKAAEAKSGLIKRDRTVVRLTTKRAPKKTLSPGAKFLAKFHINDPKKGKEEKEEKVWDWREESGLNKSIEPISESNSIDEVKAFDELLKNEFDIESEGRARKLALSRSESREFDRMLLEEHDDPQAAILNQISEEELIERAAQQVRRSSRTSLQEFAGEILKEIDEDEENMSLDRQDTLKAKKKLNSIDDWEGVVNRHSDEELIEKAARQGRRKSRPTVKRRSSNAEQSLEDIIRTIDKEKRKTKKSKSKESLANREGHSSSSSPSPAPRSTLQRRNTIKFRRNSQDLDTPSLDPFTESVLKMSLRNVNLMGQGSSDSPPTSPLRFKISEVSIEERPRKPRIPRHLSYDVIVEETPFNKSTKLKSVKKKSSGSSEESSTGKLMSRQNQHRKSRRKSKEDIAEFTNLLDNLATKDNIKEEEDDSEAEEKRSTVKRKSCKNKLEENDQNSEINLQIQTFSNRMNEIIGGNSANEELKKLNTTQQINLISTTQQHKTKKKIQKAKTTHLEKLLLEEEQEKKKKINKNEPILVKDKIVICKKDGEKVDAKDTSKVENFKFANLESKIKPTNINETKNKQTEKESLINESLVKKMAKPEEKEEIKISKNDHKIDKSSKTELNEKLENKTNTDDRTKLDKKTLFEIGNKLPKPVNKTEALEKDVRINNLELNKTKTDEITSKFSKAEIKTIPLESSQDRKNIDKPNAELINNESTNKFAKSGNKTISDEIENSKCLEINKSSLGKTDNQLISTENKTIPLDPSKDTKGKNKIQPNFGKTDELKNKLTKLENKTIPDLNKTKLKNEMPFEKNKLGLKDRRFESKTSEVEKFLKKINKPLEFASAIDNKLNDKIPKKDLNKQSIDRIGMNLPKITPLLINKCELPRQQNASVSIVEPTPDEIDQVFLKNKLEFEALLRNRKNSDANLVNQIQQIETNKKTDPERRDSNIGDSSNSSSSSSSGISSHEKQIPKQLDEKIVPPTFISTPKIKIPLKGNNITQAKEKVAPLSLTNSKNQSPLKSNDLSPKFSKSNEMSSKSIDKTSSTIPNQCSKEVECKSPKLDEATNILEKDKGSLEKKPTDKKTPVDAKLVKKTNLKEEKKIIKPSAKALSPPLKMPDKLKPKPFLPPSVESKKEIQSLPSSPTTKDAKKPIELKSLPSSPVLKSPKTIEQIEKPIKKTETPPLYQAYPSAKETKIPEQTKTLGQEQKSGIPPKIPSKLNDNLSSPSVGANSVENVEIQVKAVANEASDALENSPCAKKTAVVGDRPGAIQNKSQTDTSVKKDESEKKMDKEEKNSVSEGKSVTETDSDSDSDSDSDNETETEDDSSEDCDVNCHKKCEKLMPHLCGINQKLIVEALSRLKKGSTSTTSSSASTNESPLSRNPDLGLDERRYSSGRVTPPATSIPRYRKYNLEDFQFLKLLGKGSFGKVLLAELKGTDKYYAVKCLKKDVVLEDDDVECTLIERKVLALGTKHPYLCHLFCTFQTESHLFFVMEYLNGGDLMFHIQQTGRFPEPRARFYAAEIISGLRFLHTKGIVYRDLKLDNILLDFDGHVRIADFGMCKLQIFLDRTADTFCGTPDYMAPEIIKGLKYNQCVDWWSFGILLYEMLVGQSPFTGCDEDELFWCICNEVPKYPRFLTYESTSILMMLLEKDQTKRLGTPGCPAGDVIEQSFFRNVDWAGLERRALEPPFKPQMNHPLDVQYFDKAFTAERAKLTPVDRNILQSMDQTQFQGFSYTNPNATD